MAQVLWGLEGRSRAIRLKYNSLREGNNGYPQDEIRAKELYDKEAEKLYREAFFLKIAPVSQERKCRGILCTPIRFDARDFWC